ncbi:MAG: carbohydrate ABC transporter permease [Clostridia bacterium]|nr:carbohydrate ABC transporter permease [Clostridia bacterium]
MVGQRENAALRRRNHIRNGSRLADAVICLFAAVLCFITLYPMYYILILSLSSPQAAATMKVYFLPDGFYLDSYAMLIKNNQIWRAYGNTIIYVMSELILRLVSCLLMAYPLTVKGLRGRKFVVIYLLIPMYFGGGMIPNYLLITKLGMYNTMWALIIPGAISIWHIILMRTYLTSLPDSLRESAFIDGANHFQVLAYIYTPVIKPIIAVISIYTIVGVWNSWFSSMIYQTNTKIQPLQMYLRRVLVDMEVDVSSVNSGMTMDEVAAAVKQNQLAHQIRYSMIIFTTLPVLFTYPFFQKHFVKGVMLGSLKE